MSVDQLPPDSEEVRVDNPHVPLKESYAAAAASKLGLTMGEVTADSGIEINLTE